MIRSFIILLTSSLLCNAAVYYVSPTGNDSGVANGTSGNPFATLCYHCYARHAPPKDEICPHKTLAELKEGNQ